MTENKTATLGIIASAGFCLLLLILFFEIPGWRSPPIMATVARMNLAGLLLATVGGFSSFLSYTVFDGIRGYNRISLFLGFFALFAVTDVLSRARIPKAAVWALCGGLLAFRIWDQVSPWFVPHYRENREEMLESREFVNKIEANLPPGVMVFQLPYEAFPEEGPVVAMQDYSHGTAYLNSRTLRWSYGAIRGSAEADSQRDAPA